MNTTMNFLKPLDWITCRGYYVFRSLNYAGWDAKFTAILNSELVLSCLFMVVIDAILLQLSPETLQVIYNKNEHSPLFIVICYLPGWHQKMQIKQEICIDSLWAKRQEFYFQ